MYLSEALHPLFGFLFGWTLILVIQAGSIAAVTIAFARFFSYAVEVPASEPVIASLAVVGLTAINFLGIRKGAVVLDAITAIKILAIMTPYILAHLTYFKFLSVEQIAGSSFVAADAAREMLGPRGVAVAALLVSLSALGCAHGMVLSGARVIYAMARDGRLPKGLAQLNPRNHSPNAALAAQMAWTLILVWSGSYDQLFTYVVFAAFLFYGLAVVTLFVLRRQPLSPGQEVCLMPFYPVLPCLYLLFTVVFTLNALIEKPWESVAGLGLVALGIPAYWHFTRSHRGQPGGSSSH